MKKTILAAFSALALLAPSAIRADEPAKEYNMVITLQNGTTITLGHNDIKNITFNGEEISISGNAANTIEQLRNENLQNRQDITAIADRLENYATLPWVMAQVDELRYRTDAQDAMLETKLNANIQDLKDYVNVSRGDIDNLKAHIAANEAAITTLNAVVNDLQQRNVSQDSYITALQGQIDYLNQVVNDLYKKIEEK